MKVRNVKLDVLGGVVVLLGNHDTILEKVLVDGAAIRLGDDHLERRVGMLILEGVCTTY